MRMKWLSVSNAFVLLIERFVVRNVMKETYCEM